MNFEQGLSSRLLVVLYFSSIVSGRTYQTQPLIFALRNYYGQPARAASTKTERSVEEKQDDDDEYEYEDEEDYYEPPRVVFKPLIVVLLEGLMSAGNSLRPGARAQSYEEEEDDEEELDEEASSDKSESSSMFTDALALPFKLLQQYGMSALSSYFPAIEQLKTYGQFYENLTRGTKNDATAQLKEGVQNMTEKLRKGSQKSAINGPRPSTYESFGQYFPYAIITVKLASYFVPGLGQVKTALVGLEVIRISWKTASMYNNGDSLYDIAEGLGREMFTAVVGRRAELEPLQTPSTQTAFVDLSSMDVDTFLVLAEGSDYPPLKDSDERALREDITNVVNSYMGDKGLTTEQKTQVIDKIETAAKFIALHAIIPALMAKTSGSADPE